MVHVRLVGPLGDLDAPVLQKPSLITVGPGGRPPSDENESVAGDSTTSPAGAPADAAAPTTPATIVIGGTTYNVQNAKTGVLYASARAGKTICPDGYTFRQVGTGVGKRPAWTCVPPAPGSQQTHLPIAACPDGSTPDADGNCPEVKQPDVVTYDGTFLQTPREETLVACPAGFTLDPSTGYCVQNPPPAPTGCPAGQYRDVSTGQCVPLPAIKPPPWLLILGASATAFFVLKNLGEKR